MQAAGSASLSLSPPRQNELSGVSEDGVGPTQPRMSPVMDNVYDDGGWLHLHAVQAEYDDQDACLDDDNDSVAGEASDVSNLCNGDCAVFNFVGVRLTFRSCLSSCLCGLACR
jgi:hypothetical protein